MNLEIKKLGDVCDFYNGKAHEKSISDSGKIKVVNSKFVSSEGVKYKLTEQVIFPLFTGDICLVMSDVPNGKTLAKCFLVDADDTYSLNQRVCAIRTSQFDMKFLFYQLNRHPYLLDFNNGENQTNLRKDDILNCPLWMPPIPEQKRIVALLDTVFADLEQTRAKTEQNLKNSRELFDSYLQQVFSQKGEGWVEKKLIEVCVLQRGFDLPKRLRSKGKYPLVSSSGITDTHVEAKVTGPGVVTGRSGSIGNVFYIKEDFWPLNTALYIKEFHGNNEKFISWLLRYFDLSRFTSGAGVPTLNRNFVHDELVNIPVSVDEQFHLVAEIEKLQGEVDKVIAIYKKKLVAIDELKKSILQKAFSGELSATAE